MADAPTIPPDPVRTTSLSGPIAVSTALLVLATGWAIYDEGVVKRPYVAYQEKWISAFADVLDRRIPEAAAREAEIRRSPEFLALDAAVKAAEAAQTPEIAKISNELAAFSPWFDATGFAFRDKKGKIDEYVNRIENASGNAKKDLEAELAEFKAAKFKVEIPVGGGKFEAKEYDATTLIAEFVAKKAEQGRLQGLLGQASGPVQAARKLRADYLAKSLRGLSAEQLEGLHKDLASFEKGIKQIHAPAIDLVDRCESCHLGAQKPIDLKVGDFKTVPEEMRKAFVSHPRRELLALHDTEKFGCSLCHGGNGVAVTSVEKGHGRYKHWLWPMHDRENTEAGCVACHTKDVTLKHGPVVSEGKEIFRSRGCWGCHRYEGFDVEADALTALKKEMLDLKTQEENARRRLEDLPARKAALNAEYKRKTAKLGDEPSDEALSALEAQKAAALAALNNEQAGLSQTLAAVETTRETKRRRETELHQEMKKIGPNLKEAAAKLDPRWLPVWLRDPAAFRPDTRMPNFDAMTENQRRSVAAFIWSRSAKHGVTAPKREKGDAAAGKKLFVARGCTACHAVGEGEDRVGNDFAANLSRVGEKANFDYLVHWVQHPRSRLLPYSPDRKRDLVPADYAAKGLPFAWTEENPRDPETGGRLIAHNYTVMPDLRLSDADARDIATYLTTLKTDAEYEAADWLTSASPEMLAAGEKWTKHFGCAGCHEIAGLEDEQRIGTELTVEGSKPIERLDFALLTHEAKHPTHPETPEARAEQRKNHPYPPADEAAPLPAWYTHKGFFMGKLKNPQMYDVGKVREVEDVAALKMPNFRLDDAERVAVTTFLLGSVETSPRLKDAGYFNLPEGRKKAIQEGWWVVKKYNCQGCHSFEPGEAPPLWGQPWFASTSKQEWTSADGETFKNGAEMRPPTLIGQGFRTDPQWLAEFLRNPALSKEKTHRNGVRSYLNVRMPTFHLSNGEVQKLVAFFGALSDQPTTYIRPEAKPLNKDELAAARDYFAACAKCHAKDENFDPAATAPTFALTPKRLNPDWVARWIQDPQSFVPGTKMPVWFKQGADGTWRFNGATDSKLFDAWQGDHVDLLRRYLARYDEYEGKPK